MPPFRPCETLIERVKKIDTRKGSCINIPTNILPMTRVYSKTLSTGIAKAIKLAKVFGKDVPQLEHFKGLLEVYDKIAQTRGLLSAINLWKYWYNSMVRFTMLEPNTIKPPMRVKRNRQGWPIILKPFMVEFEKYRDDDTRIRLMLTQFRSFELATVTPVKDFSTILDDSPGPNNYLRNMRNDFKDFMKHHPFTGMVKRDFKDFKSKMLEENKSIPFHYTVKSGISGSSLGSGGYQSLSLTEGTPMRELLISFNRLFYQEDLDEVLDPNIEYYSSLGKDICNPRNFEEIKRYYGKLSFIPDKGGKTRVVAIGNYWVQNTLKPLHDCLFSVLRHIAMDGTYDQGSQSGRVAHATTQGPVWSYDLTAATDRLPLNIQVDVMTFLDGEMGPIWNKILDEITFLHRGKGYKYKVGQPMGLYSSWASLALTHHFIIQYCAKCVGFRKETFMSYSVLGDDVAIWHKQVAEKYESIIELLGVNISKAKSYIPDTRKGIWKAEFAKRIFLSGKEMSGISPDVLKEGFRSFWCLPELFNFLLRHGLDQIVKARTSRVAKVLGLSDKEIQLLSCAFRINELLGGPLLGGDESSMFDDKLKNVTLSGIMQQRRDRLTESISDLCSDLFFAADGNREELEELLGGGEDIPEYLLISRVIETRIVEMLILENRMKQYIPTEQFDLLGDPDEFFNQIKASDEVEYEDNILTKIKDIEFIPSISLSEIVKGITLHKDKKTYRVEYMRRLTQKLLADPVYA